MVDGYWGKPTANYDWCEDNYVLTPYVAEFWNALSSLPTLTVGLYFLLKARKHAYGYRFEVAGAMLAIVGLGSAAFHGTLTRWGQILDEVPMLYSSSVFLWIAGSLDARGRDAAATRRSDLLGAGLTLWCMVITAAYLNGGFELFFIAYAGTVAAVAVTSVKAARASLEPAVAKKYCYWAFGASTASIRVSMFPRFNNSDAIHPFKCPLEYRTYADHSHRTMSSSFIAGIYVGGFLCLWVPEQVFCGNRLQTHHHSPLQDLPLPLHAFFHVTSSAGPLSWLTFAAFEELRSTKRKPAIRWGRHVLLWGAKGPEVVPRVKNV